MAKEGRNFSFDKKAMKGKFEVVNVLETVLSPFRGPLNSDTTRVVPFAIVNMIWAVEETYDSNINATSMVNGTYYGRTLVHSDETLTAKSPKLAAKLKPVVMRYLSQYYTSTDPVAATMILDAIGCIVSNSRYAYAYACQTARSLDVRNIVDENNYPMDKFFINPSLYGADANLPNYVVDDFNVMGAHAGIHGERVSRGSFNDLINAKIMHCFLSNTDRDTIYSLFNNYIKYSPMDADTDRYAALWVNCNEDDTFAHAASDINTITTRITDLCNMYTFLPEILNALGLYELREEESLNYDSDGMTLKLVNDKDDNFKDVFDHICHPLAEQSVNEAAIDAKYNDYLAYEIGDYRSGDLSYTELGVVDNVNLSVLMKNALYYINATYIVAQKTSSNVITYKFFCTPAGNFEHLYNANWTATWQGVYGWICSLAQTTKLVDSDYLVGLGYDSLNDRFTYGALSVLAGLHSYRAHSDDISIIRQYAELGILFDHNKIIKLVESIQGENYSIDMKE